MLNIIFSIMLFCSIMGAFNQSAYAELVFGKPLLMLKGFTYDDLKTVDYSSVIKEHGPRPSSAESLVSPALKKLWYSEFLTRNYRYKNDADYDRAVAASLHRHTKYTPSFFFPQYRTTGLAPVKKYRRISDCTITLQYTKDKSGKYTDSYYSLYNGGKLISKRKILAFPSSQYNTYVLLIDIFDRPSDPVYGVYCLKREQFSGVDTYGVYVTFPQGAPQFVKQKLSNQVSGKVINDFRGTSDAYVIHKCASEDRKNLIAWLKSNVVQMSNNLVEVKLYPNTYEGMQTLASKKNNDTTKAIVGGLAAIAAGTAYAMSNSDESKNDTSNSTKESANRRCSKCGGDGTISKKTSVSCHACGGSGKQFGSMCLTCGGWRTIQKSQTTRCPKCGGDGYE